MWVDLTIDMVQRSPRKASIGDKVAVVSPSFAAPAIAPAVHEQAMRRLAETTGLVPKTNIIKSFIFFVNLFFFIFIKLIS